MHCEVAFQIQNKNQSQRHLAVRPCVYKLQPRDFVSSIHIFPNLSSRVNFYFKLIRYLFLLRQPTMQTDKDINAARESQQKSDVIQNEETIALPQKRYFRQRAHVNPICDHDLQYPLSPDETDWSQYYVFEKNSTIEHKIRYLDVGCGFGGLLISLSGELLPGELALGMEIRTKVSDYVQKRIIALRSQYPGSYGNVWCVRTNAMRYIPNYIDKGQLSKMFFLFPDPHFKKTKHKWRIINDALLAEYAYICAIGAIVYIATDVRDLYDWMVDHFNRHPLFQAIAESDLKEDKMIKLITTSTEESKKVERNEGDKFYAAFRRIEHK